MTPLRVITISGHAQHGKDTSAEFLKEIIESHDEKVLITHYADLLKYICKAFFDWNGSKDDVGRSLLQSVGTDIVRNQKPNFWVDFIADILHIFDGYWDYVIIPDTRFPNEIYRLKEAGFNTVHLRVVRDGFESFLTPEQKEHLSEKALDKIKPDFYIENNGDLHELHNKIEEWVTRYLYE